MKWPWQSVITKATAVDAKSVLSIQTRSFAIDDQYFDENKFEEWFLEHLSIQQK